MFLSQILAAKFLGNKTNLKKKKKASSIIMHAKISVIYFVTPEVTKIISTGCLKH